MHPAVFDLGNPRAVAMHKHANIDVAAVNFGKTYLEWCFVTVAEIFHNANV